MNSLLSTLLTTLINLISGISSLNPSVSFSTDYKEEVNADGDEVVILTTSIKLKPSKKDCVDVVKKEEPKVEKKEEPKVEKKEEPKVEQKEEVKVEEKKPKVEEKKPKVEEKKPKVEEKKPKVGKKEEPEVEKKEEPKVEEKNPNEFIVAGVSKKGKKKSKREETPEQKRLSEKIDVYYKKVCDFHFDFEDSLHHQIIDFIELTDITQSKNILETNLSVSIFKDILMYIADNYEFAPFFYKIILIEFVKKIHLIYKNASKSWTINSDRVNFCNIIVDIVGHKYFEGKDEDKFISYCYKFMEGVKDFNGWSEDDSDYLNKYINYLNGN